MFNSPLLDITIGLVFIFLIYSLLVTSINEAIASLFGLRARMLKSAIVVGMLSNTSKDSRWKSLLTGIKGFFGGLLHHDDRSAEEKAKIGEKIFDHPLIKNYGSSRFFPLPSYIPTNNFSTVLIDVLIKEFNDKVKDIARYKLTLTADNNRFLFFKLFGKIVSFNSNVSSIQLPLNLSIIWLLPTFSLIPSIVPL